MSVTFDYADGPFEFRFTSPPVDDETHDAIAESIAAVMEERRVQVRELWAALWAFKFISENAWVNNEYHDQEKGYEALWDAANEINNVICDVKDAVRNKYGIDIATHNIEGYAR